MGQGSVDCEKFDQALEELWSDSAAEAPPSSALQHAANCERCSAIEARYRALRDQLPDLREPPPATLESRILEREALSRRPASPPLGERLRVLGRRIADLAMRPQLVMSALLVLLVGTSLLVWHRGQRPAAELAIVERGIPDSPPEPARPAPAAAAASNAPSDNRDGSSTYASALANFDARRYAEALPVFESVAAQSGPNAASAAFFAAECVRRTAGCGRARERFEAVSQKFKGTSSALEAEWQAAECYRSLGEKERALDLYRALAKSPAYAERVRPVLVELERPVLTAQRGPAKAEPAPAARPGAKAKPSPSSLNDVAAQ